LKIINNIKDFLIDKEYYIDIFDDKLHAFNYLKLLKLNDTIVELKFEKFILEIKGTNIKIVEMNNQEILLSGNIDNVRIKR
jgi:hypothetical protein